MTQIKWVHPSPIDPTAPPFKTLPSLLGVTPELPGAINLQAVRGQLRAAIDAHDQQMQQEVTLRRERLLDDFRAAFAADVPFELRAALMPIECVHWGDEDGRTRVGGDGDDEQHLPDDPVLFVRWPGVGNSAALQVTIYAGWADGHSPTYPGTHPKVWHLQAADATVSAKQYTPHTTGWAHLYPVDAWVGHDELAGALLFHLCRMQDAWDAYYAAQKAAIAERERTTLNRQPAQTPAE